MIIRDPDRARHLLAERRRRRGAPDMSHKLTEEWFPEERLFFDDPAQLAASICGRSPSTAVDGPIEAPTAAAR